MTPLTSGYVMEKYYIARTAGSLRETFLKKGYPSDSFPKTFNSFWQGADILTKYSCVRSYTELYKDSCPLPKRNRSFRKGGLGE